MADAWALIGSYLDDEARAARSAGGVEAASSMQDIVPVQSGRARASIVPAIGDEIPIEPSVGSPPATPAEVEGHFARAGATDDLVVVGTAPYFGEIERRRPMEERAAARAEAAVVRRWERNR